MGKESELFLRIGANRGKRIYLDLAAFLPKEDSVQQVEVKVNDVTAAQFTFTTGANRKVRSVDVPENANEQLDVKLLVSKPTSPKQANISGDARMLGVALYGITTE